MPIPAAKVVDGSESKSCVPFFPLSGQWADEAIEISIEGVGFLARLVGRKPKLIVKIGETVEKLTYEEALALGKRLGVKSEKLDDIAHAAEQYHRNATKEAIEQAAKRIPASEKQVKSIAKRIERELGKDARREFHDLKDKALGDRTMREATEDAISLYEDAGKEVPQ